MEHLVATVVSARLQVERSKLGCFQRCEASESNLGPPPEPDRQSRTQSLIDYRQAGNFTNLRRQIVADRGDLGTASACSSTFLQIPSALLADNTGRERLNCRRQDLHDSRGQPAISAIEVRTLVLGAGCCETKHLGRFQREAAGEDFGRSRQILLEILQHRSRSIALHHAQHPALVHTRLRAGTKLGHETRAYFSRRIVWATGGIPRMMCFPIDRIAPSETGPRPADNASGNLPARCEATSLANACVSASVAEARSPSGTGIPRMR